MGNETRSKRRPSYPAVLHLIAYGFAIALPLVLVLAALLFQTASYERDQWRQQILRVLGALTDSLDRDLDRQLTSLQTLAVSSALQRQDWPAFYEGARAALHGRGYVVLIDASGRQLVNTYVPYGQAPPFTGDPQTLRRMTETKQPVFSNLFTSLVVKKPVLNISVPVLSNGELRYVLSLGLLPDDLAALLGDQTLNPNWISIIWDANNRIVARSRDNNEYVGHAMPTHLLARLGASRVNRTTDLEGEDVLYATSRSKVSGWGVGVNVPVRFLERPYHITSWLGAAALLAILLAVGLGILSARQVTKPLAAASKAASELGRGQPPMITYSPLKEAELFLEALQKAESELSERAAQLRASQAMMTAMVEQMPCGVGLTDRDGRWVIANQIMRHFVPKQLPSQNPEHTKRWQGFDANGNPLDPSQWPGARALRGETVSPGVDFSYTNDEGKEQWLRIASAPFRDVNGSVVGATTIIEDVSEQKRLAEIEKLLFHELQHRTNNLLGVIQAIAQKSLLAADQLTKPEKYLRRGCKRSRECIVN